MIQIHTLLNNQNESEKWKRIFSEFCRPKHLLFENKSAHEHSSYESFINSLKAQKLGLKVYSELGYFYNNFKSEINQKSKPEVTL